MTPVLFKKSKEQSLKSTFYQQTGLGAAALSWSGFKVRVCSLEIADL